MELFRELGYPGGVARALLELGRVAYRQGDDSRAVALFVETIVESQKLDENRDIAFALVGLAAIAGKHTLPECAARLFGAAEALREAIGNPLPHVLRAEYEQFVATARAQLDEATFAAAWMAGRALPLEQAIAEALRESPSGNDASPSDPRYLESGAA